MPLLFLSVSLQMLLTLAAGWLLWMFWRRLASWSARAGLLIGIGLVLRAFMAEAMFWISYLHLPIARPLQDGEGFWKLAIDAHVYFGFSQAVLTQGLKAVVLVDKTMPSPVFVQVLAVFILLFGSAAAVGAFLNLFVYLGACAAILRLGRTEEGQIRPATLVAVGALSFAPAVILWSAQPLKDPFFIFAVAAFVAACAMWQDAWLGPRQRMARFVVPALLIAVLLYAVVGVRWYFGLILWIASAPFFVIAAARSDRRMAASLANGAIFVLLSQVIVFAGGPYLPPQLARLLGARHATPTVPLTAALMQTRAGFDASSANSMIQEGSNLRQFDKPEGGDVRETTHPQPGEITKDAVKSATPATVSPAAVHEPAPPIQATPQETHRTARIAAATRPTAGNEKDVSLPMPIVPSPVRSPDVARPGSTAVVPTTTALDVPSAKPVIHEGSKGRQTAPPVASDVRAASRPATAQISKEIPKEVLKEIPKETAAKATPVTVSAAAPHERVLPEERIAQEPRRKGSSVAVTLPAARKTRQVSSPTPVAVVPVPHVEAITPAGTSAKPPSSRAPAPARLVMPRSTIARLVAGVSAVVLPHAVGEWLGLIQVGGGRGLWAIIEIDTLVFDFLLIAVAYYVFRGLSQGVLRNGLFWLVALMTPMITVLLCFTISNFGTLFRHRAMIFMGLCLLIVVAGTTTNPRQTDETAAPT